MFKMLKFVSCIVLFVCLWQQGWSIPISNEPSNFVGKSLVAPNNSSSASEIITNSFSESISQAIKQAFATLFLWFILHGEIFTVADGTHLFFPPAKSDAVEKEHQVISIAAIELWTKLQTMERVDGILANATTYVLENIDKVENFNKSADTWEQLKDIQIRTDLFALLYDRVETLLKADAALYTEFAELKRKIEQTNLPAVGQPLYVPGDNESTVDPKNVDQFLSLYPKKRSILVNKVFVLYATTKYTDLKVKEKEYFNNSVTAKSILKLASQPGKNDAVQAIYQAALEKATELTNDDENCTVEERFKQYNDALFQQLSELFGKQPELNAELKSIEQDLFAANVDRYTQIREPPTTNQLVPKCTQQLSYALKPLDKYRILFY